jgi:hypothetical protein
VENQKKIDVKRLALIISIATFLICCGVAWKVFNHYEMYSNDPLIYGAKVHDIEHCLCQTGRGVEISFNQKEVRTISAPSLYG